MPYIVMTNFFANLFRVGITAPELHLVHSGPGIVPQGWSVSVYVIGFVMNP